MTASGMLGDEYALVTTEISGKEAWLFVPLKDLEPIPGEPLPEVMAQLVGCWEFWAGGSMSLDYLQFNADGTFCNPAWPNQGGTFTVTAYDPAQGKYWDKPPYELTLVYHDGGVTMCGLSFGTETDFDGTPMECFSLTNWEGGGGYIRINVNDVPFWPGPDGAG